MDTETEKPKRKQPALRTKIVAYEIVTKDDRPCALFGKGIVAKFDVPAIAEPGEKPHRYDILPQHGHKGRDHARNHLLHLIATTYKLAGKYNDTLADESRSVRRLLAAARAGLKLKAIKAKTAPYDKSTIKSLPPCPVPEASLWTSCPQST